MENYRKMVEVLLPSEDHRDMEAEGVAVSQSGVLIPTKVHYEQDWPQKIDFSDFQATVYFKHMQRQYSFYATIRQHQDDHGKYSMWFEAFEDEFLLPNVGIDLSSRLELSEEDINLIVKNWRSCASESRNLYFQQGASCYIMYTIKHDGYAHTIMDVGIVNEFSVFMFNSFIFYIYQWMISMFSDSINTMRNHILENMMDFGHKTDVRSIFPREIDTSGRIELNAEEEVLNG